MEEIPMCQADALKPCPFCGAAAHFEMDADRWEWIACESCGMQGNRSASLGEDCKPKLREEWNRRAAPVAAPEQAVAWLYTREDHSPSQIILRERWANVDKLAWSEVALAPAAPGAAAAAPEPARPDILEKLTYQALQRDDLSLDECLTFLRTSGWHEVPGRTPREMVLQILSLLASQPSTQQGAKA